VPDPEPLDPLVTVSQLGALLTALHVQPEVVLTLTEPLPAADVRELLVGVMV
jgi:hypothetical protein